MTGHAFLTWGAIDMLPSALSEEDREFFEFSLFLESFGVAAIVAFIIGPRVYRAVGEHVSAWAFYKQKNGILGLIDVWIGLAIILRRLSFDHIAGVNRTETIVVVAVASLPVTRLIAAKLFNRKKNTEPVASGQRR